MLWGICFYAAIYTTLFIWYHAICDVTLERWRQTKVGWLLWWDISASLSRGMLTYYLFTDERKLFYLRLLVIICMVLHLREGVAQRERERERNRHGEKYIRNRATSQIENHTDWQIDWYTTSVLIRYVYLMLYFTIHYSVLSVIKGSFDNNTLIL